jgi:DNA-binding MarR family transcriptional regulator
MPEVQTIEEAIQQKKFKNSYHKMVVNLFYSYHRLSDYQDNIFKKHEITSQQYNILRILKGRYPESATVGDLVERMMNKMCDASRLVDKLKAKGWVERITCPEDRRAVNLKIAESGLKLLELIEPEMSDLHKRLGNSITEEEAAVFSQVLDKMRNEIKNQ